MPNPTNVRTIGTFSTTGGPPAAIAVTQAVAVGERVIVFVDDPVSALTGVTDSKGNTYTVDWNARPYVYSAPITTALTTSDTISLAGTGHSLIPPRAVAVAAENCGALDKVGTFAGSSSNPANYSASTGTLTQAEEVVFGAAKGEYSAGVSGISHNEGAGYTELADLATTWLAGSEPQRNGFGVEYKTVESTFAVTVDGSMSGSSSFVASGVYVTYLGVASSVTHEGAASLSGASGLTASALAERPGSSAPSGASNLSATASVEAYAAAALSGNSALVAAAVELLHAQAALSASSTLFANEGNPVVFGAQLKSLAPGKLSYPQTGRIKVAPQTGSVGQLRVGRVTVYPDLV